MLFAWNRSGPILIIRFFVVHSQNFTKIFIGKIIHEHLSYQRARKTEIFESFELSCSSWASFKLKTNLTTVTVFLYKVSFMKNVYFLLLLYCRRTLSNSYKVQVVLQRIPHAKGRPTPSPAIFLLPVVLSYLSDLSVRVTPHVGTHFYPGSAIGNVLHR